MKQAHYPQSWFRSFRDSASRSAEVIVPRLMRMTQPKSVIDIGCGLGTWLRQFRDLGVRDIQGVDGHYVSLPDLLIDMSEFRTHDLRRPFETHRRYDLCLCLEVAEHLPAASADGLVESLTQLAPIVCFSAAIPQQGGTHHVNEQWPEYWVQRFAARGYRLVDGLRRHLWNDPRVDFWYAQNAVLFATDEAIEAHPELRAEYERTAPEAIALIHPYLYLRTAQMLEQTWDYRLRKSLRTVWNWAARREAA